MKHDIIDLRIVQYFNYDGFKCGVFKTFSLLHYEWKKIWLNSTRNRIFGGNYTAQHFLHDFYCLSEIHIIKILLISKLFLIICDITIFRRKIKKNVHFFKLNEKSIEWITCSPKIWRKWIKIFVSKMLSNFKAKLLFLEKLTQQDQRQLEELIVK